MSLKKSPQRSWKIYRFYRKTACTTLFSVEVFKDVINKVLNRMEPLLYIKLLGYEGFRKSIVENFWNNSIKADEVKSIRAQQGLDIVSKALINNQRNNDEKPTYSGALAVLVEKMFHEITGGWH